MQYDHFASQIDNTVINAIRNLTCKRAPFLVEKSCWSFVSEFLILLQSKYYINQHNHISLNVVYLNRKDTLV